MITEYIFGSELYPVKSPVGNTKEFPVTVHVFHTQPEFGCDVPFQVARDTVAGLIELRSREGFILEGPEGSHTEAGT